MGKKLSDAMIQQYVEKRAVDTKFAGARAGEKIVCKIFKDYKNQTLEDVMLKVAILNTFYHTHIEEPYSLSKHISKIKCFSKRLMRGDLTTVSDITAIQLPKTKKEDLYIFATKYCFFSNPEKYFIYDPYVSDMVATVLNLTKRQKLQLKNYEFFSQKMNEIIQKNALKSSHRDLDVFFWTRGKELAHMPNNRILPIYPAIDREKV